MDVLSVELDSFQPAALEGAVSGGRIQHLQLKQGHFQGRLLSADLGESRVDWGGYNLPLLAVGDLASDCVTCGLILESIGPGILNGSEVRGGTPVVLTEGQELHYRLAPGSQWLALQIERGALEGCGVFLPRDWAGALEAPTERARSLKRDVVGVLRQLRAVASRDASVTPFDASAMQEVLLGGFCRVWDEGAGRCAPGDGWGRGRHLRLVRRALDCMEAHLSEPLRIGALCAETAASWSTLERAFARIYGLTPKAALDLRRMSVARQLLLAGTPEESSVTELIHSCGIHHVGRFSARYRALFGERPSETLARRAPRAGVRSTGPGGTRAGSTCQGKSPVG